MIHTSIAPRRRPTMHSENNRVTSPGHVTPPPPQISRCHRPRTLLEGNQIKFDESGRDDGFYSLSVLAIRSDVPSQKNLPLHWNNQDRLLSRCYRGCKLEQIGPGPGTPDGSGPAGDCVIVSLSPTELGKRTPWELPRARNQPRS